MWTPRDPTLDYDSPATNTTPGPRPSAGVPNRRTRKEDANTRAARRLAATQVIEELMAMPPAPSPTQVSPAALTQLLDDVAPAVYARSKTAQHNTIAAIARAHDLPTAAVLALARDTGTMIAKTTHARAPNVIGDPALNRLLHADRALAAELLLARARLTWAQAHSDPDLPRLWMTINGLHHGIDAHTLFTQPAQTHGPLAEVIPERDDLIGWHGITTAITQLQATIAAATAGRAWLKTTGTHPGSAADRMIGLGVLQLTHPRTAHEIAASGPDTITLPILRQITSTLPSPEHVIDLSDGALKAVCDRNNWLHGTLDERTHRELVERHAHAALGDARARLAGGDTRALTQAITHHAPTTHPPTPNSTKPPGATTHPAPTPPKPASSSTVPPAWPCTNSPTTTSPPHPTRAAALTARFPQRLAERGLTATPEQLLTTDALLPPRSTFFEIQDQLDLGF